MRIKECVGGNDLSVCTLRDMWGKPHARPIWDAE